jgi:ferrous iron transport protein A
MSESASSRDAALRPLDQLAPGESGVVARLDGPAAMVRRMMELGMVPGTTVKIVRRAPLGDPIELSVRGVHLSLRASDASLVHVTRT